jgi:single-strand DNA-binding protein
MLNRIIIMGRFTRDPEMRRTQSGTAVASFTLAVDRDFKDKTTGERATDFIDCVAWRTTAELIGGYFSKGRLAAVEGSLQIRDWTDKNGNKRRSAEVMVNNIYFADSRKEGSSNSYGNTQATTAQYGGYGGANGTNNTSGFEELGDGPEDGDLPF